MGNSVPMAVDSESQLVELRILLGILGVGDFSAGRRQGNKDKMEKGAEHTPPVYIFFSHKTADEKTQRCFGRRIGSQMESLGCRLGGGRWYPGLKATSP